MSIQPNGKKLFNEALPKNQGGHAAMLREDHEFPDHLHYLKNNISNFAKDHNVGTLGLEIPPFMMLLFWAHRDGKLAKTPAEADQLLKNALLGYRGYAEKARAEADLIITAHAQGVEVIGFDARKTLKGKTAEREAEIQYIQAHPHSFSQLPRDLQYVWALNEAEKIYKSHPEYAKRLDAIEQTTQDLHKRRVPTDVIGAIVASQLAQKGKNMITISGKSHLMGIDERSMLFNNDVTGIFDEALAKQHWKTTDMFIGNQSTIMNRRVSQHTGPCGNYDQLDAIYAIDTDKVKKFDPQSLAHDRKFGSPIPGLTEDIFSCIHSPSVEKVFKQWELDPTQLPGVTKELEDMKKQMQTTYAHPAHGPTGNSVLSFRPSQKH